jgi:hypothetical protein
MSSFIYVEFEDNDPLKTKESTILFLWGNYSNLAPSEKTVLISLSQPRSPKFLPPAHFFIKNQSLQLPIKFLLSHPSLLNQFSNFCNDIKLSNTIH